MGETVVETVKLHVPREFRRGFGSRDEVGSVQRGLRLVDLIEARRSTAGAKILDFGCGVKVAQALIERGAPQELYAGVDVFADMIEYMKDALKDDPRFHFETVNFQNDMYNPDGQPLIEATSLPVPDVRYDIMTMFSVVTHMVPADTEGVLRLLARYAHGDTVLIFSAFAQADQKKDFVDALAEEGKPLHNALYRQAFLEEIIARAGWTIREFNPPIRGTIANFYVCRPAG